DPLTNGTFASGSDGLPPEPDCWAERPAAPAPGRLVVALPEVGEPPVQADDRAPRAAARAVHGEAPAGDAVVRPGHAQAVVPEVARGERQAQADRAPAAHAPEAHVAARRAPARPRGLRRLGGLRR